MKRNMRTWGLIGAFIAIALLVFIAIWRVNSQNEMRSAQEKVTTNSGAPRQQHKDMTATKSVDDKSVNPGNLLPNKLDGVFSALSNERNNTEERAGDENGKAVRRYRPAPYELPKVWPPPSKIAPPRGETFADDVGWPAKLEEAMTPELRDYLGKVDARWIGRLDYELRLLASLQSCVGDAVDVGGGLKRVETLFHFAGEPHSGIYTGTDFDVSHTQLTEEEDEIVLACVEKFHRGAILKLPLSYGADENHQPISLTFPLGMSWPYRALRERNLEAW